MSARFEIVRTDAGWHSRFVASNGETVWSTEIYTRSHNAGKAILSLARAFGYVDPRLTWNVPKRELLVTAADPSRPWLSVLCVDERESS